MQPRIAMALLLLASLPAFGQEQSHSPYEVHLKTDLPIFAASATAALIPVFHLDFRRSCPCLASNVNRFDRIATANNSPTIDKVSTGAVAAAVAWPGLSLFFDANPKKDALTDGLVVGQAVLVNVAVNQTFKLAIHRPRPLLYGNPTKEDLDDKHNYLSFYSQHTSVVFSAGMSYARTFALRHPKSSYRWLVYSAAAGGGAAVASMRVLAGKHFPTDVITGAAAGTSIGLLIPQLHRKQSLSAFSILPTRGGAALSVQLSLGGDDH